MSIFFILLPECRPVIGYIQNYRYPYKIIGVLKGMRGMPFLIFIYNYHATHPTKEAGDAGMRYTI